MMRSNPSVAQRFFLTAALGMFAASSWAGGDDAKVPPAAAAPAAASPATPVPPDPAAAATAVKASDQPAATSVTEVAADPEATQELSDSGYRIRIKNLEEKVNELKENIFRAKSKLTLLTETVAGGSTSVPTPVGV